MSPRNLLTTLSFLLFFVPAWAQNETANWFFANAWMKVTKSGVSPVPDGNLPSYFENRGYNTVVSDSAGNLIFVTDGNYALDRNLQLMPGLLRGNIKSDGKLLTAAIPGTSKYYIFYTQSNGGVNASATLKYAIVDLAENNGLGAVTQIEQVIDTALSPAITLVQGENTGNQWLVAHRHGSHRFLSFAITPAGLNTTPVISEADPGMAAQDNIYRDLTTAPNGKMIAGYAYRDYTDLFAETQVFIEVFNFDAATGKLKTKVRTWQQREYLITYFGLAFSPSNQLLYTSQVTRAYTLQPCGFAYGSITQYNLCYNDPESFSNYKVDLGANFANCSPGSSWVQMQLGADGRIHLPYTGTTVSQVLNPNRIGTAANYNFDAYQLPKRAISDQHVTTLHHRQLEKAVKNNIVYSGGCFPAPLRFSITNDTLQDVRWNFGDPSSGSNTSNTAVASHQFSAPGFYRVEARLYNRNGLFIETLTDSVEIRDPAKRLLEGLPRDSTFCPGKEPSAKLSVMNGIFSWRYRRPGESQTLFLGTGNEKQFNGTGTYIVEMRQNGCGDCFLTDSIRINVLPHPYVDLGTDRSLCGTDTLQLGMPREASRYLWNTGDTTSYIRTNRPGTYWVEAEIDNNGCVRSDTVVVKPGPGVRFAFPADTTLCSGQELTLNTGVSNAFIFWQDGSNNTSLQVNVPGTYWANALNANGCQHSDTIRVSYVDGATLQLGKDTTLCQGDSLVLDTRIANARYQWQDGNTQAKRVIKQSGTYWVKVSNGACTVSDTIIVNFSPPPAFSLGRDTTLCEKEQLVLRTSISGASYLWSDGSKNNTLTVQQNGSYWLAITRGGCTTRDTVNIAFKPQPQVSLGNDTVLCQGSNLQLQANTQGVTAYQWQDGTTLPTRMIGKSGAYTVRVWGSNGCTNADTIVVQDLALPAFSLGRDTSLCTGESLLVNINIQGAAYLWSNGSTSGQIRLNNTGMHWLEVQRQGCTFRDSIALAIKPLPKVYLGRDTTLCEGAQLLPNLQETNARYQWSTGAQTPTININTVGIYWIQKELNGCMASDTMEVAYQLRPRFTLGRDTSLCTGQSLVLDPGLRQGNFRWQNGSSSPTFTINAPGMYTLTVANTCGITTDEIKVAKGVCQLWMPSAFTPNSDGLNDLLRVKYPGFIKTFSMQVYNRWGQVVFQTNNPKTGWNGRYRNLDQPDGNYLWTIELTTLDGNHMITKGDVLLLR